MHLGRRQLALLCLPPEVQRQVEDFLRATSTKTPGGFLDVGLAKLGSKGRRCNRVRGTDVCSTVAK